MSTLATPFRIAVLISGGGTTLKNLIERIRDRRLRVEIALVVSSSPDARGLQFARDAEIPTAVVHSKCFASRRSSAEPFSMPAEEPALTWWSWPVFSSE